MAMIIQARYEQLDECASRFGRNADRTTRTLRQLHAGVEHLRASWQGAGAEAFLNEMEAEVLPATQRLVGALAESQRVTRRMADLLRAAEEEAAALFRSEPISSSAAIPFAAPLQQEGGEGKRRVERTLYKSPLEELIASLEDGAIPLGDILDEIRRASPAEQLAMLNNPDYMALIEKRFGGSSEERVIVAALLEGLLFWPRGSWPDETGRADITVENPWTGEQRTNDFARWIRGEGPPPDLRRGNMNCWEYLMFSAYLAGDVNYDDLVGIHNAATNAYLESGNDLTAYYSVIETALGAENAIPYPNDACAPPPPAGSIIFFDTGGGPLSHVAIATGRLAPDLTPEVMSLWTLPRDADYNLNRSAQLTSVFALNQAIEAEQNAVGRLPIPPTISYSPNLRWGK